MNTVRMRALKSFPYAGRQIHAGTEFDLEAKDELLMRKLGRVAPATYATRALVAEVPAAMPPDKMGMGSAAHWTDPDEDDDGRCPGAETVIEPKKRGRGRPRKINA